MKVIDINPFVRYANITEAFKPFPDFVYPEDCRLFFVLEGSCKINVSGTEYYLPTSSMIFVPEGESYKFSEYKGTTMAIVNFDFDQSRSYKTESLSLTNEPLETYNKIEFEDFTRLNEPLVIPDFAGGEYLVRKIVEEFEKGQLYYRECMSALLKNLFCNLVRHISTFNNFSNKRINLILDYISQNLSERLDSSTIAAKVNYHPYYVSRLVRVYTGKTLKQYIITLRINEAKELLKYTELPLVEIAVRTGFENAAYFSNSFKARVGMNPTEYRKNNKNYI